MADNTCFRQFLQMILDTIWRDAYGLGQRTA